MLREPVQQRAATGRGQYHAGRELVCRGDDDGVQAGGRWAWLGGVAGSGLVLFNVAVVRGVEHAEPAVIGIAVASVPLLLAVVGPLLSRSRPAPVVVVAAGVVTAGAALVHGGGRTDAAGLGWAAVVLLTEAAFPLLAVPVLARLGRGPCRCTPAGSLPLA